MAFFSESRRTPPPPAPDPSTLNLPLRTLRLSGFGGPCEIAYLAPSGDLQASRFEAGARAIVDTLESRFYSGRGTSTVAALARGAGRDWVKVDPETEQFLTLCGSIPFMTQGAMDPSCGPLQSLWEDWIDRGGGFPDAGAARAARELCGWSLVEREPGRVRLGRAGMSLACDSLACAYAADAVARLAGAEGVVSVLARMGSSQRAVGCPPGEARWRLEVPLGSDGTGRILSNGQGVSHAGGWARLGRHEGRVYLPVVDPRSGLGVAHGARLGVAIAPSALQACVLAHAALVMGLPKGTEFIQSFPSCEGALYGEGTRGQTRSFSEFLEKP